MQYIALNEQNKTFTVDIYTLYLNRGSQRAKMFNMQNIFGSILFCALNILVCHIVKHPQNVHC